LLSFVLESGLCTVSQDVRGGGAFLGVVVRDAWSVEE